MSKGRTIGRWKERAGQLKIEIYALYLAYKDPRVPWYAKVFAALVVGYAFSPIDLIPDFIPVLGYLDDLILIPIGVALALKMMPESVMDECRENAQGLLSQDRPINWIAAAIIAAVWLLLIVSAIAIIVRTVKG